MTTTSWAGASVTSTDQALTALVDAHGVGLHRLAAVLTADSWKATELVARTLTGRGADGAAARAGRPVPAALLKADLVRRYLGSAPRRAESVRTPGGDAGDVLRRLSPRARAACALRLVERWSTADTAAALGVRERRVSALVPGTPGLELALLGLADQHALTGPDLRDALLETLAENRHPAASGGRRRWGRTAAAALPLVLLVGYLAQVDRDGGGAQAEDTSVLVPGTSDLTEAGWRLDEDGDPPRVAMGLHLRKTVMIDKGGRTGTVRLPEPSTMGFASFGALWCDMPPAQDEHLEVPAGTLTVDGAEIELPCAGRDGSPPVSRVVALPPGGAGTLEVSGDMPGDGIATLGVYTETEEPFTPLARGSLTDAPPVEDGAVALETTTSRPSVAQGRHSTEAVSIGHDSTIRVWAGRTGAVSVNVDGVPATDDGDLAMMRSMYAEWSQQENPDTMTWQNLRNDAGWSTQQADVRDGRWLVPAAGQVRTFALPPEVRPAPGQRRTVVVEVVSENVDDHLQVAVTDASSARLDTSPVAPVADHDAPELVLGHRLVSVWEVPSDGLLRELRLDGSTQPPDDLVLLVARRLEADDGFTWGEGIATRGAEPMPLWIQGDVDTVLQDLRHPWFGPVPPGPDPLSVAVPAAVGHPPATLLAYVPVPYEEFDFAAAAVPPGVWPGGTDPPPESAHEWFRITEVIGPEDLKEGRATMPVIHGETLAARVTTEGKGRIRFLVEGQSADGLWTTDGWWSSWTEEPVTSEVDVAYSGSYTRPEIELTVVVEGYEDFRIEVLTD